MAALLNFFVAVTINGHLVWNLRTKLDSASTVKLLSNIQNYKCIQPGIEATAIAARHQTD